MKEKNKIISQRDYTILQSEFLDKDFILEPEYFNCRIDKGGKRFYVRYYDEENYIVAPSFSALIHTVTGVNPMLAAWMADKGKEESEFIKINSANYGTYVHILFSEIMKKKSVYLNEEWFFGDMEKFCDLNGHDFKDLKKWYRQAKRKICDDVIGFFCWLKDYNVKPIAMEYPLMHPQGLWAGTCDLICKLTIDEKEIIAMVDFKTTLTPFFEDNEIQLHAYKQLWDLEHPDLAIDKTFNYGCNNFRKKTLKKYLSGGKTGIFKPYQFKDQTDSKNVYKWEYYLSLFHGDKSNLLFDNKIEYDNYISIDKDSDLTNIMLEYDILKGLLNDLSEKVSENKEVQELVENLGEKLKDVQTNND